MLYFSKILISKVLDNYILKKFLLVVYKMFTLYKDLC